MIFYTLLLSHQFLCPIFFIIQNSHFLVNFIFPLYKLLYMILGKYETKKRLGKGAFGDVLLAQDKNKNLFAVKMISLRSFAG